VRANAPPLGISSDVEGDGGLHGSLAFVPPSANVRTLIWAAATHSAVRPGLFVR